MKQIASFIMLEIAHAVIAAACTATYSVILRTKQKAVPIRSRRRRVMATGPKSSKTATNEYRISIEGNPYPHTLALINPAGDNLSIKRHGFTGPLGQLLSLKYTVYDDANEKLFTVVDGGFSNMPRVALIIEHKEVAVFDYGLNRLEMKCDEHTELHNKR